ncbi:MAG: T9SS type A sorting domain-containing protein, partial [Muribaculaceae bacterium]|nr:T9SS type A sorting domain-containing protein [Muribaculaceae bacterium]
AGASTTYSYSFSGDDSSVKFDWIDIETNGLGSQHGMSYYLLHDYIEVELPFEFPFYGQKYDKMYVYNSGFVSFTKRNDDRLWPQPPADFPSGSIYTNIIAPYWGMHTMDQTRTAGTFHYTTDDYAVVSFIEYGNSMNIGVDFQLVLYKDGTFKFQYKPAFNDAVIFNIFGLAGIANADGSNSIRLPERMVSFDNAVAFSPIVEAPVAPGSSETVSLDFDTRRLAGTYTAALKVATNVPGNETLEIPVTLDITGQPDPQWPADVTVEHVLGYRSTDYTDPMVQMGAMYAAYFNVENTGTAAFTIDNIEVDGPTVYDEWFDMEMNVFTLFVNQPEIDWITGEPTGRKSWGTYEPGFTVLNVGNEPAEFAIPMLECEQAYTPGDYNIKLTYSYTTDAGVQQHVVNVKFVVTPAPAMTFDRQEVYVKASGETDIFNETVVIGNSGDYRLTYSISLDPTGAGEEPELPDGGGIAPWANKALSVKAISLVDSTLHTLAKVPTSKAPSTSIMDVPGDFEYTDALYYPATPVNPVSYNYGSNSLYDVYKAATVFTAPADGINISHIYLPVTIGTATDYSILLEVITGNTVGEGDVIGRGKFIIESQADPNTGQFYVVPLNKPVFLNPNEEFYVQATYDAGVAFPAYVVTKEEAMVEGRYMGWTESIGWFDVAALFEEQYGSLGYILTCLETSEGSPWIKLLTPEGEAVLETGASTDIKLEINTAAARLEKNNKAMIVIKGNDPSMPLFNLPVVLDKNGAPVIETPAGTVYAKEGTVTNVPVIISDPDSDDFTVAFNDARGNSTISVSNAGNAVVTTGDDGIIKVTDADAPVTFNVAIEPEYGSASAGNIFDLTVTDAHGLSAEASVRYNIEHVNRAPVTAEIPQIAFTEGTTSDVYRFADMFSDPDGDELKYTFEMNASRYVEAYPNATGVVFYGKRRGKTTATVTATDPSGESVSIELPIEVKATSGINDATADNAGLTVTPNPIDGDINVYADFTDSEALFVLYDASGRTVFSIRAAVNAGQATVLPGSNLAQGIYILTATADGRTRTVRVVKL